MLSTYIVRGWLDDQEWGDEPPDPDDIWTTGDRVRLKNSAIEGTVHKGECSPFLGGYLPYVFVQWDGKPLPVFIEPDLLIRLTRNAPDGLTWQAEKSFSEISTQAVQETQMVTETSSKMRQEYPLVSANEETPQENLSSGFSGNFPCANATFNEDFFDSTSEKASDVAEISETPGVPVVQQKDFFSPHSIPFSRFMWRGSGRYWIKPEWVRMDLGTQCRVSTDRETVQYYAAQMRDELWEWEASVVRILWDGDQEQLIPYDGHHRLSASAAAEKAILAQVDEGNLQKAIALSCGSNKKPSLRRTKEDNQKTILMLETLRKEHGDKWLLEIINADLSENKRFKEVSLRAIEAYTGIPFTTINNIRKRSCSTQQEKVQRINFAPSAEEMSWIETIMDAEGFEKPFEAIRWLIERYKKS